MGRREWRVTIKSQCWFRTTRPNPTIQMSAAPIKVVPGNLYACILMMLSGFRAFLETCRELPQSWFTTHTMNPSLHLRSIPCQWCLTGPRSTSPKYWLPGSPCFITTAPFTLWGLRGSVHECWVFAEGSLWFCFEWVWGWGWGWDLGGLCFLSQTGPSVCMSITRLG